MPLDSPSLVGGLATYGLGWSGPSESYMRTLSPGEKKTIVHRLARASHDPCQGRLLFLDWSIGLISATTSQGQVRPKNNDYKGFKTFKIVIFPLHFLLCGSTETKRLVKS